MKYFKLLLVVFLLFSSAPVVMAQDLVAKEEIKPIFTDKDKDFLQLWYYEQVLKMDLDEEARYDYLGLLTYYTYKMRRLSHPKYNYTDEEQKMKFREIVQRLDTEMQDYLSEGNYKIHKESFGRIIAKVNEKKGWED